MLRLVIVDDEKVTRESLKEYIPWSELGIGAVDTAKNGLSALELVRELKPDILITDVRMPKMDGIELAARVRELLPLTKIIFLSGYADKEYLKSAIHLKAVSYIEKPVNMEEIKSIVRDAVALCREESERLAETEKLKSSIALSLPLIRQKIALELVKENPDITGLCACYGDPFLKLPQDSLFTAVFIELNWKASLEDEKRNGLLQDITRELCEGIFSGKGTFLAGISGSSGILLLLSFNAADEDLQAVLIKLKETSGGSYTVSIGIGSTARGFGSLPGSYAEAVKAARRQFYKGPDRLYRPEKGCDNRFEPDRNLCSTFRDHLKKGDKKAALWALEDLTARVARAADPDTDHIKNIYFNLLLRIFEVARERELLDTEAEDEKRYIWQEIDEIRSLAELSRFIASNVEAVFIRLESKDSVNRKTAEVMKFIRDKYPDKRLSIQMIAGKAYLSPTYLCSFFKKSTGKTINEYITEVRIEKAKELLRENRVKLYEIASNTGFTDTNYFSTLFKKYAGCTPSEFREKNHL